MKAKKSHAMSSYKTYETQHSTGHHYLCRTTSIDKHDVVEKLQENFNLHC